MSATGAPPCSELLRASIAPRFLKSVDGRFPSLAWKPLLANSLFIPTSSVLLLGCDEDTSVEAAMMRVCKERLRCSEPHAITHGCEGVLPAG